MSAEDLERLVPSAVAFVGRFRDLFVVELDGYISRPSTSSRDALQRDHTMTVVVLNG